LEQTSRSRQSSTGVSAPYRWAISAGVGLGWWRQPLHHTTNRTRAPAALPSVIGGPGSDFMTGKKTSVAAITALRFRPLAPPYKVCNAAFFLIPIRISYDAFHRA
jgi:hypothetical protein